jgi:hypothetical protein
LHKVFTNSQHKQNFINHKTVLVIDKNSYIYSVGDKIVWCNKPPWDVHTEKYYEAKQMKKNGPTTQEKVFVSKVQTKHKGIPSDIQLIKINNPADVTSENPQLNDDLNHIFTPMGRKSFFRQNQVFVIDNGKFYIFGYDNQILMTNHRPWTGQTRVHYNVFKYNSD